MTTRRSCQMAGERVHRVVIEVHVHVHDGDHAQMPLVRPLTRITKRKRNRRSGWPKNATGDRKTVARLALALTKGKSDPSERAARSRVLRWRGRLVAAGMTEQNALFFIELAMIKRDHKRKPVRDLAAAVARDVKRSAESLSRVGSRQ